MNLKVQSMNQRKLVVKTLALYHLVKHICHRSPPTLRSRNQLLRRSSVSEIVPVTGFQYVSNRTEVIVTQRTICYCQQQAKRNDLLIECGFCNEVYHGDCVSISPMMMVAAQSRKLKWGCTSCAAIRKIEDTKLENLKKGIKNTHIIPGWRKKKIKVQQFEEYVRNGNLEDGAKFAAKYAKLFPVAETALLLTSKSAEVGKLYLEEVKKLHPF